MKEQVKEIAKLLFARHGSSCGWLGSDAKQEDLLSVWDKVPQCERDEWLEEAKEICQLFEPQIRNVCRYEDWDDTTLPHPVCHCLKRENVECLNAPDDVRLCPDYEPKGEKPPVLSDKKLKEWVIYRTGSTFLYDHEKGVLLDLVEQAKAEVARGIINQLIEEGVDAIISGEKWWESLKEQHGFNT